MGSIFKIFFVLRVFQKLTTSKYYFKMATKKLVVLALAVQCVLPVDTKTYLNFFNYTLNSQLLNSITQDEKGLEYLSNLKWFDGDKEKVKQYFKDFKLTANASPKEPFHNLYSFLQTSTVNKCLVVVNNFAGVNIQPTIALPVILRKFEMAVLQAEYFSVKEQETKINTDMIWIPKDLLKQVNGNFSTEIH